MARLERLCGTSLCRTPAGGLWPSSGPLAALSSKIAPGDFVELGVLIWSRKPAIHKKTPLCGAFLWMARLERFELPTARFVALLAKW